MNRKPEIPLLRGVIVGWTRLPDGRFSALLDCWCPHCRRHHQHVIGDGETKPTHRAAHCDADSPFNVGGYFVAPWRKRDPESAGHAPNWRLGTPQE